jgi:hypothetical protein
VPSVTGRTPFLRRQVAPQVRAVQAGARPAYGTYARRVAAPRHPSHRASRIRGERPGEPSRSAPLPEAEDVADPARPRSLVDHALTRRGVLERIRNGDAMLREDHTDADPYLVRAARHHGEATERPCPICRVEDLVHVTYVFGDELGPFSGRVKSSAELPVMAYEHGHFRVYVVEVCTACGWNHMTLTYVLGDGVPRRPLRKPQDLLD